MIEIPDRSEFLTELGTYITSLDPEVVGNALALYGYDNGLDAASATSAVDREARRDVMETLGEWATDALGSGELSATGDDGAPVDPSGPSQRAYPDLSEFAAAG